MAALGLLAAGCATDDPVGLDSIEPVAALQPFDSCAALLDHLRAEAVDRVGPYGFDQQYPVISMEDTLAAEAGNAAAAPLSAEPDPGVSGTNVQEAGVDEPDLAKADRDRLVLVQAGRLTIVDLTGAEPAVAGRLDLPSGSDHELLVAGDTALVLTRDDSGPVPLDDGFSGAPPVPSTTVTEVDLSDQAAPQARNRLRLAGVYVSARMQGSVARVVVSSPPPDLGFVHPAEPTAAAEARAEAVNRSVIEASTLEDWMPGWALDSGAAGHLDDCDAVHRPAEVTGFGLVSVLTVDLAADLGEPEAVSVLGTGGTVYASADNLYVATERRDESPTTGDEIAVDIAPEPTETHTAIHRFSAPATGPVAYEASGQVEGRLLNQFSMSEHDDVLRVATTRGEAWSPEGSDSLVTTLGAVGDELTELGRVEDLGRGEQIFAVRFVGPVGYVVTFRQTDPLYVVDLRDPSTPTVDGELKILGYSAYLHPIDETHVLGIGQDAEEDGATSGTQLSLFDVSDPTNPVRTAQHTVPGAASEVEWDHRAFLWWAPTATAVLPVERYGELDDVATGALVVDVDVAAGSLTERGRVDHTSSPVRRSIVVDDTLVTVDGSGLVFSSLTDLTRRAELAL
jgi:uncharacterized secreted protein with C-terminal beta-propeller domain